jgi:hypothetical protein
MRFPSYLYRRLSVKSITSMKSSAVTIFITCIIAILLVINIIYLFHLGYSGISNATILETMNDPLFIIIMASYPRKSGKSPYYIKKAVTSILGQSYSNWKLYVTGDNYENESEFRSLFNRIPSSKLFLYNLPEPGERNNLTGMELWESGGVAAMNNAIERAEQHHNSCRRMCKIFFTNHDDDDIWSTEHLNELLSIFTRFPSVVFTWTKGYYCGGGGGPFPVRLVPENKVNNWSEQFGGSVLHSAWAWNMSVFRGFRYRGHWDFPPNYNGTKIADADLFEMIRAHIQANKLDYYHSNRATIEHLIELEKPCIKNGPLWYPD